MKKFVFSLQSVYEYKQTLEKTQKAELSRAENVLRELRQREHELEQDFERNRSLREEALTKVTGVLSELEKFDAYFRYLHGVKKELAEKILRAEEVKARCQAQLIATMKELKIYTKLKDEQYARYLKEVAAEEEKEISDIVSFSTVKNSEETAASQNLKKS